MIRFDITTAESRIVQDILDRAEHYGFIRTSDERLSANMDIVATHANGCPLDFARWVDADAFNFAHDLAGITKHLNRSTGRLTGHFRPRFAKVEGRTDPYEDAARAAGWDHLEAQDEHEAIYWHEASERFVQFGSWEELCELEGIEIPQGGR